MTRARIAIAGTIVLAILLAAAGFATMFGGGTSALGQEATIPDPPDWPPFIAVVEMDGAELRTPDGQVQVSRETRRLVWNAEDDWKSTTISATPLVNTWPDGTTTTRDYTGSYQEQSGRTFTTYDADLDITLVRELEDNHYMVPFGLFNPEHLRNLGIVGRIDGDLVVMDVYICDGASCDSEGATGQSSHTADGVLFDEYDIIFTDDENLIPLEAGDLQVQSLHTNPPKPPICIQHFPNQRVTNPTLQMKREPFTHAMQSWDPRCQSSHAPTHNAQFYTFVNHDVSDVNGETVLATMRVNIKMTTRHDDVQLLLLGAQLLDGLEPDAPIVATAQPVEAEAGALRTLEIEKVVPYGAYTIEVRARNPGDAVFDLTAAHVPEPPAFDQDTYTFSVAEDAAQYASVGTVSATDPGGEAVTYRITSGAAGKFDIDANAGIIVVRSGLDYESAPTYTLTVEARNPDDRTGTATVTINVTDVAGT